MKIGFIGLGKMGGNMVSRILKAGHQVVVLDLNKNAVMAAVQAGAQAAADRADLVKKLITVNTSNTPVPVIWMMIPAQYVDTELDALLPLLPEQAILVDGGNSDYRLTQKRAEHCAERKVHLIDVGTSGGILGLENGYAMMAGGDTDAVNTLAPILDTLAPPGGWHHFGPSGSGHYTKMVHNAIEYGVMEAYAEGYRMLKEGPISGIDLAAAGEVWQHGSIIESLLNRLTAEAVAENSEMNDITGFVSESGETRWALETAKDLRIPLPAIEESFNVRLRSQKGETNYATKLLAAMRNKFGGHAINGQK